MIMLTDTSSYETPVASVVLIEVEESVLGEKKSGNNGGGAGTEPIVDPGTSHGWG